MFDLGNTTYTPDLYLPEFDIWIEIKGWWWGNSRKKFNFVKKYFPIELIAFEKKELTEIGVI